MTAIVFATPGLIDLRAFTMMGVSVKPQTANPIGYFGTGLKYAMAVLVRLGAEPVVWIGRDKYTFQKKLAEFRGQSFEGLRIRCERFNLLKARYTDLPYTTSYGRNWKMWQAFRELEANTRDESGTTLATDAPLEGADGKTLIVIEHPEMVEAWEKRADIFLPGAVREADQNVQVFPDRSKYLYWRGLKVAELHKPTVRTYNVCSYMELTEDRTLKYDFYARDAIARHVLTCDDERLVYDVLTAGDEMWEHGLTFDNWTEPSRAFRRAMDRRPKGISSGVYGWWGRHDDRVRVPTKSLFEAHPTPWRVVDDHIVLDAKDDAVFDEPGGYNGRWVRVAEEIIKRLNAGETCG
jgi:hypothetical protein